jgi:hypothetical protein
VGNQSTGQNSRLIGGVVGDGNASVSLQYIVAKRATPTLSDISFQYFNASFAWVSTSGFSAEGTHSGRAFVTSEPTNRLARGQFAASAEL